MHIEKEEAKKVISRILESGVSLVHSKIINLAALPAAGKAILGDTLKRKLGSALAVILTVTDRPMREHETNGKEYIFCKPEEFDNYEFIEGMVYEIDGYRYGVWMRAVVEALESGAKYCLINTSAEGTEVLAKIFGQDLFVALLDLDEDPWTDRLYLKFKGTSNEKSAITARFAFGKQQLKVFKIWKQKLADFRKAQQEQAVGDMELPVLNVVYNYSNKHQSKNPDIIVEDIIHQAQKPVMHTSAA